MEIAGESEMNERKIYHTFMDSPVGRLVLTSDGECLIGLDTGGHGGTAAAPRTGSVQNDDAEPFALARKELGEYFAGRLREFSIPVRLIGTEFQQTVWAALREIPYGVTVTYGEQARKLGNPNASRAVGLANGRNPIAIIVPCHRVIGANGKLTGYAGGLDRKDYLLALEKTRSLVGV
jgi:methylated-DNA-[protein]-cysteine S-methyltransferase